MISFSLSCSYVGSELPNSGILAPLHAFDIVKRYMPKNQVLLIYLLEKIAEIDTSHSYVRPAVLGLAQLFINRLTISGFGFKLEVPVSGHSSRKQQRSQVEKRCSPVEMPAVDLFFPGQSFRKPTSLGHSGAESANDLHFRYLLRLNFSFIFC